MPDGVWEKVASWINRNAQSYVLASIPPAGGKAPALKAYESYLRVWLCEMFLAERRSWLRTFFPAVHAEVRLDFAGQQAVTFSRVVRPEDDALGEGVLLNYPLTELMPFSGGTVEIETTLLGLKAADDLAAGVALLQSFSTLLAPPLGQALTVAEKLAVGARDFLDRASAGVHLALHQTLTSDGGGGSNVLRPGYVAVMLATRDQVPPEQLRVQADRLHRLAGDGDRLEPFTGHDYMLLRLEGRGERDNWRSPEILEARQRAIEALRRGDRETAAEYRGVALAAVLTSHDLAAADQRRIADAIKKEWQELASYGLGATLPSAPKDLSGLLARYAMPKAAAVARGPLTAEEVFAS